MKHTAADAVRALTREFGKAAPPDVTAPLDVILWENVAYLVNDERRRETWKALRAKVGTRAAEIIATPVKRLAAAIEKGGMGPARRAEKLRAIAELAEALGGDLNAVVRGPVKEARKALKRFPGIGDPGADKVLLFARAQPVLALDSNGLRVLLRLGYGTETKNYGATYKSVQRAVEDDLGKDFDALIAAHQVLRRHGQEVCTRTDPQCGACPLAKRCPSCGCVG